MKMLKLLDEKRKVGGHEVVAKNDNRVWMSSTIHAE